MNIIIAGDYFPTYENEILFEKNEIERLFGNEILELFENSNLSLANLEGSFTDGNMSIKKSGPNIKASRKSFEGYSKLKLNCVSMANNHIMDYGIEGLNSTIELLKQAQIDYFGAGYDLHEARQPFVFEYEGIRIGLYSCAEYEFTIASKKEPGANPFDPLEVLDDIRCLKACTDFVVVIYHGGKEYYRYPAPYLQRVCRKMVESGADIVLCQHSHCVGCEEKYQNKTILYGQGNFMFNRGSNEYRNSGLLVKITIPKLVIEYIPIMKADNAVRLAKGRLEEEIMRGFWSRSEEIKKEGVVEEKYKEFADSMVESYDVLAFGIIGKILSKIQMPKYISFFRGGGTYDLKMINCLRCEAHRDLYRQGLLNRIQK